MNMKHFTTFVKDQVLVIQFDMEDKTVNLLNQQSLTSLKSLMTSAYTDDKIQGIVIQSAKDSFCMGADVNFIQKLVATHPNSETLYQKIWEMQSFLLSFEKPTVAIINGRCLGGGLELALACHYRVGIERTKLQLALPEVRLGIIPGLGGTQRLPRLIGLENALQMLLKGAPVSEDKALSQGLLNSITTEKSALKQAIDYIHSHNPRDHKDKMLNMYQPDHLMTMSAASALAKKQTQGCYVNVENLLQAVYEGHLVSLESGLKTETEYFVKTLLHPSTQAMLKTLYIDRQALRKKAKDALENHPITQIGIIGGGFMGGAIAAHAQVQGLKVVVIETDQERMLKAKEYIDSLVSKYSQTNRTKPLPKVTITKEYQKLKGCELVIEAVFEDLALKRQVLRQAEQYMDDQAVLASNTSTIPITLLAEELVSPKRFVGIHFFSPVAKMALIEVIAGKLTNKRALDFGKALSAVLNKTPIIVKDIRGFYTSNVCMGYIYEAITLLTEGVSPTVIENAAKQIGMPAPPLALVDEIGIDVAWHILQEAKKDPEASQPSQAVLDLVDQMYQQKRLGRKTQKGFYLYEPKKQLWPELMTMYPHIEHDFESVKKRLFDAQVNTAKTIQEKGYISKEEANVGAILGLGFCPQTGGPIVNKG